LASTFPLTARQQKIEGQGLDAQGNPIDSTAVVSAGTAMQLWKQLGTANASVAQALGIPEGTQYSEQMASSVGGGVADTSPFGNAPVQQMEAYNALKNDFAKVGLSGQRALSYLAQNYDEQVKRFGKEVVDAYADEIYAGMYPEAIEEEPVVEDTVATDFPKETATLEKMDDDARRRHLTALSANGMPDKDVLALAKFFEIDIQGVGGDSYAPENFQQSISPFR